MLTAAPAELARTALRRIAELRVPPTPQNFERHYNEAAGTLTAAPPAAPVDPKLMQRVEDVVARASATTDQLAAGLDRGTDELASSLDHLVEAPLNDTARILEAVVASTRTIQSAVQASHAELLEARRNLTEIKAELIESRKLLGRDLLTGTENRRALGPILDREIARSRRDGEPLALAIIDVDHFKDVNDTLGHEAGDAALVHLTRLAKAMLRGNDAFVRYGGEEFLLVLPETALQGGVFAAERLQTLLAKKPLVFGEKTVPMTFSAGVTLLKEGDSDQSLIRRADSALYEAKRGGRNRVVSVT